MSRPLKNGLEFFSLDIDISEDPKIEYLEAKFGLIGFAIYIKLLIRIYHAGYYIVWSEREQLLFLKRVNVDKNPLSEIVNVCINEGLFDINAYINYSVLTSCRIQKQYIMALSRRKNIVMHKELVSPELAGEFLKQKNIIFQPFLGKKRVNVTETSTQEELMSTETPAQEGLMLTLTTQTKLKETKGNYTKVKEDILSDKKNKKAIILESDKSDAVPYKKIIDHLNSKIGSNFKHTTKETRRLIDARWNSGFRLEDFYYVIDIKAHNWLNDEKMRPFLRPCTLFGTKFESYRNERPKCKQPGLLKFLQKEGVFDEQE